MDLEVHCFGFPLRQKKCFLADGNVRLKWNNLMMQRMSIISSLKSLNISEAHKHRELIQNCDSFLQMYFLKCCNVMFHFLVWLCLHTYIFKSILKENNFLKDFLYLVLHILCGAFETVFVCSLWVLFQNSNKRHSSPIKSGFLAQRQQHMYL